MKIGVIGWWHYDNQGDLAMLAAVRQALAPHQLVPIDIGFPPSPDSIIRLNRLDFLLLGGGTLITGKPAAPFDTFEQWGAQLHCPLGVVGLGIDAVHDAAWPAVQALLARAEFFYVRDRASRALLPPTAAVQVAPDLTFATPLPVSARAGRPMSGAPRAGVNLRRTAGFDPAPWLAALAGLPVALCGLPFSSFGVFEEAALLSTLDPACPARFDPAGYQTIDLMIGVAFHAMLFAVQAAVPMIAIGHTPKVRHFMEENGLARYLLPADAPEQLPAAVAAVLDQRAQIGETLRTIGAALHQAARQNLCDVRARIERRNPRPSPARPPISVVMLSSGDAEKDQRTREACCAQTHPHTELLTIPAAPATTLGARLLAQLHAARGEYVTWIDGGDWFAADALDCLAGQLEQDAACAVLYADYFALSATNLPLGYHVAPDPAKLYRRDVVGPCFVMRRALLAAFDAALLDEHHTAYGLWLRLQGTAVLAPFHAPLFYSARPIHSRAFVARERAVRRRWRRPHPPWSKAFWRLIDTELGERWLVQPLAHARAQLRRRNHAEGR